MTDADAAYADWYVWAKRNLANDSAVCHAAAAAATAVELAGGSRAEAIAAARQVMTTGAHLGTPDQGELRRRSYAEWFDWARRELGGVREQQHAAARAAIAALDSGLGANAAMEAARQAAGLAPPAPAPPVPAPAPAPVVPVAYAPVPPQPPAPPAYAPPGYAWPPPAQPQAFAGYAGFWRRFAAYLVDVLVLVGSLLLISLIGGFVYGIYLGATQQSVPNQEQITAAVTVPVDGYILVSSWLYFTILEASPWQATLGKLALGIRVTDLQGRRIGWARANARYFSKIVSGLILGIGYLMAGFTERKQALHDMIAATLVVRR